MLSMKSKTVITVSVVAVLFLISTFIVKKPKGKPGHSTPSPGTSNNSLDDSSDENKSTRTKLGYEVKENTTSSPPPILSNSENVHDFTLIDMDDIQMDPINSLKVNTESSTLTSTTEIQPQVLSPIKAKPIIVEKTSILMTSNDSNTKNVVLSKKSNSPQRNQSNVWKEKIRISESKLPLANKKDQDKLPGNSSESNSKHFTKSSIENIKESNGSRVKSEETLALNEPNKGVKKLIQTLKMSPVPSKKSDESIDVTILEKSHSDMNGSNVMPPLEKSSGKSSTLESKQITHTEVPTQSVSCQSNIMQVESSLPLSEMKLDEAQLGLQSQNEQITQDVQSVSVAKQSWNIYAPAFVPSVSAFLSYSLDQGKKKKKSKVSNDHPPVPHHTLGDFFSGKQNQQQQQHDRQYDRQHDQSLKESQVNKCIFGSECHNKNCTYFHPTEECK